MGQSSISSTLHLLVWRLIVIMASIVINNPFTAMAVNSDDIPRGTSKESPDSTTCGLTSMPDPVLAECTEPIADNIPNHIGVWTSSNKNESAVSFRIEQCSDRYTVSGKGNDDYFYIHDLLRVDGTLENGVQDFSAFVFPACQPIAAAGAVNGTCLEMRVPVGNTSLLAANRCLSEDGTMEWYNLQLGDSVIMTKSPEDSTMAPTASPISSGETPTATSGGFWLNDCWTCLIGFLMLLSVWCL